MWMWFAELDADARNALDDSDFAWIDKDGGRHLPIHDAGHVRNALARINQTKGLAGAAKKKALAKIRARAAKFGIDTSKQAIEQYEHEYQLWQSFLAAEAPKYGPGGDLDWDDKEEPDESEDDTRAGDPNSADEGGTAPAPGLTSGDVHVNAPVNSEPSKKRSKTLKFLTQAARQHFASGRLMTAEQFNRFLKQAQGKQGGLAKKRADEQAMGGCGGDCCDSCTGPGCGCCEACEASSFVSGESQQYREGSPHFVTPDGIGLRMFIPLRFDESIGVGDWIEYLPPPGVFHSPRYGKIEITKERNENFVRNFNSGVYQDDVPIDAEHETKLSGALGWMRRGGMRINPNGSVSIRPDWTDRGKAMLEQKRFKYFSPEWYDSWRDPATGAILSDIAIGGALTTRPFFKPSSLKPVIASEQGFSDVDTKATTEENTMAGEENKETEAKRLSELEQQIAELKKERKELRASEEAAKKEAEQSKTAAEAQKAAVESALEVARQAAEEVAKIRQENQRREFAETASTFVGETAKHVALMEKLGGDPEALNQYIETQKTAAEALSAAGFWESIGASTAQANGETSAVEAARKAAEAIAAQGGGNISVAKAAAEAWDDAKYVQYLRETGQHVGTRSRN